MFLNKHVNYLSFFIQNIQDKNKYLVSGVSINKEEYYQGIKPKKYKKILFNTEPIKHFSNEGNSEYFTSNILYVSNKYVGLHYL